MHPDEQSLIAYLDANPIDAVARAAYSDWLEEHDRPDEALLHRVEWRGEVQTYPLYGFGEGEGLTARSIGREVVAWATPGPEMELTLRAQGTRLHGVLVSLGGGRYAYLPRAIVAHRSVRSDGPFRIVES